MKPTARYTFSGVESLSFTSHDVSFRFSDGDSLSVDFLRGQNGLKMVHEECRDFLKWYGKRDMTELTKTYEALRLIIEEKKKAELETLWATAIPLTLRSATGRSGITL